MWGSTGVGVKSRIFASYHHRGDQIYYDTFSRTFGGIYDVVEDHSLDREVDSDNAEYVMRVIRENYITGSSCTVVLCGAATWGRKHVDWEIKATLDAQHGLIGVMLPSLPVSPQNQVSVPERLSDNISSGYAVWVHWNDITSNPANLTKSINESKQRTRSLIINSRPMRQRNAS